LRAWRLPDGNQVAHMEVAMKGLCAKCAAAAAATSEA